MTGRDKFKKYQNFIGILIRTFSLLGKKFNIFLFKFYQNTNGKFGLLIRYVLLKNIANEVGENVTIHPNVFLFNIDKIKFGSNISVHPLCYIDGYGGVQIGDNVSIAHNTSIISTNHTWNQIDIPIKYNPVRFNKVIINDDVWIGCGVRILAGTIIGSRSIIAAGAVVNKKISGNSIMAGVPAKKIKSI